MNYGGSETICNGKGACERTPTESAALPFTFSDRLPKPAQTNWGGSREQGNTLSGVYPDKIPLLPLATSKSKSTALNLSPGILQRGSVQHHAYRFRV